MRIRIKPVSMVAVVPVDQSRMSEIAWFSFERTYVSSFEITRVIGRGRATCLLSGCVRECGWVGGWVCALK